MADLKYDVLGIGNAIVDVIARAEDDFLVKQGMHKGGMALIDEPRAQAIYQANFGYAAPASVTYCDSAHVAAEGADAVVLLTEWNEFKLLNLERLRGVMRRPVVFDGRNLWEPERMRRLGFEYYSIGRRPVVPSERTASESPA